MGDDLFVRHRDRRTLFGTDAASYDLGRPGYPDRVYELLRERCGLAEGSQVLEIGPGTGQATRLLLEQGAAVTAVELSPDLAERLRAAHHGRDLEVMVGSFEEARLPRGAFDLVTGATCFHWIPADAGLARCAELLRDGGSVALWWTVFGDRSRPDPFHDALTPILQRLTPELLDVPSASGLANRPHYALDIAARTAEIERSGCFEPVYHESIPWTGRHTAAEIRALFGSYSPWLALPPERRLVVLDALERLAEDTFGGIVERPYLTAIYIAEKRTGGQ